MQTTPVQAELAKIWTNILRYAQFALPNLLMMDCERHGANVFEVIDLINRDYPRGGIAQPGLTAGTCLRKDFTFSEERSNAPGMLLAVSRVHESVPLFLVEGVKRRRRARSQPARWRCSGSPSRRIPTTSATRFAHKLVRLLERELADVAVHDPHVPRPHRLALRMPSPTPTWWSWQPTTASSATPRTLQAIAALVAPRLPRRRPLELLGRRPGVRLRRRDGGPAPGAREPRTGHRRGGTIGAAVVRRLLTDPAYEVRVSDQRPAPQWMREGCEVHTGDLRVPAEAREATDGCTPRHPPRGDRRRDRQLPPPAVHADRSQQRALQPVIRAALEHDVERFVYVSSSMVFEQAELFRRPRTTCRAARARSAYGFSKLTGEVYCRAAHASTACPTICRPFNAYGPGELPSAEPGIAHAVPDLIKRRSRAAAAADLRLGRRRRGR